MDGEEGATTVIKCPAGPWQGLPRPQAMLMSTPAGQSCFISAHWTRLLERRCTGKLGSLQMTNIPPKKEGNSNNWDTLDQDHFPSLFQCLLVCALPHSCNTVFLCKT